MPHACKVPELGENIETGTVVKVLVAVGDRIAPDQAIIELETGKAVLEVPSDSAGLVETIHVKAGDEVTVGQALITVSGA
ncbi:MAG: biotin/lipoyl-containing protein [Kiritimatiellia bacterium]